LVASAALAFLFLSASCAVPYSPGYTILKMSRSVHFLPESPAALDIQTHYTLENSGTTDLNFIDVNLPDERLYGRGDLHIQIDGKDVAPASQAKGVALEPSENLRVPLEAVWQKRQKLDLLVEYTFRFPGDAGTRITIGDNNFHLSSRGWYPLLEPPPHILSVVATRPKRTTYTVRIPSNFLILARGRTSKRKMLGAETEYTFELTKKDLTPFIAAGSYTASQPATKSDAVFWTLQPLAQNPQAAIARITSAWNLFQTTFGPLETKPKSPYILEAPNLRTHVYGEEAPASAPFPSGALVNPAAFALGIDSEDFFDLVSHSLAHDWFGEQMFFVPDAQIGMGEGLPEYATIVMEESVHGDTGRRQRIARYIGEYDRASENAKEEPLGITMMTDSTEQRRIAIAKAPLFFVAIEDICGETQTRAGLAQMVALLRGQQTDYGTLRASIEQTCGKNLADTFRLWLNGKGLPEDFRARYASTTAGKNN
jgi:hypothetical protein